MERVGPECAIELACLNASDKQRQFMRAFFDRQDSDGRPCDVFVALGGNRSGKSFSCGWLTFALYLRDHARHGDWFWCVGQTLDRSIGGQQQELWKALPRWMFKAQTWDPKGGFGSGHHAKVKLATHDGGECLVEFRSADQDLSTFEQAKLDGAWIDERCPEAIYGRLIPRIIDKNGFILYSDIPEQFWQLERLQEAPPEAGVYFQHFTMHDNAHNLPDGAIDKASARMTKDERDQKIGGKFLIMEGIVFKEYIDDYPKEPKEGGTGGHLTKPFPIPEHWPKYRKIDYGETKPMAVSWTTLAPNEHMYVYREQYEKGKSIFSTAKMIHEASSATWREVDRGKDDLHEKKWVQLIVTGGEKYVCNYLDPACFSEDKDNGSLLSIAQQFADAGIPCKRWPRVNEMGEHAMVQKFKYRLENKTWHVFDTCTAMRREMRVWKHKLNKDGKPVATDAYENGNNHLIDGQKGFISTNPTSIISKARILD